MLSPHNRALAELAAEEGILEAMHYNSGRDARELQHKEKALAEAQRAG